ncbi:hypothetical protein [Clostridium cylindrosporum]|uniref:Uncharacterized protein n=1 Tax=Clostridium cylindrosporum DSM 605 TaxID=1121307 RepID=A0A0J8G442_CLOCY|nr:hypothetical protein [Clostridium cylindrosporum]KMT22466.1 hypothetical protein CLCY_10c00110 [Clostridium cylindrosporum DSM 605]
MNRKLKQAIVLTFLLFLSGSLMTFIGFVKGDDIATSLSRPIGESIWETSNEMILGCTYTPVILGISLIIMSITFSTVLFINWVKEIN